MTDAPWWLYALFAPLLIVGGWHMWVNRNRRRGE